MRRQIKKKQEEQLGDQLVQAWSDLKEKRQIQSVGGKVDLMGCVCECEGMSECYCSMLCMCGCVYPCVSACVGKGEGRKYSGWS